MQTVDRIISKFSLEFGKAEACIRSPSRVNIIGEHTDYNKGYVLPFASDRYMYLVGRINDTSQMNLLASNLDERIQLQNKNHPIIMGHWSRYFQAVINVLSEKYSLMGGMDLVFGGNIPIGAGMSSSSSLTCGFIAILNALFKLEIPEQEIIDLASLAENSTGVQGGKMDQYAITLGKENHALFIDCRNFRYQQIPIDFEDYSWVLFNTNVKHNLVTTEYNDRRKDCERGVYLIEENYPFVQGVEDLSLYMLSDIKETDPIAYKRLTHVLEENQRVKQTKKLLLEGKIKNVGPVLNASHESLKELYEVSCPELDYLVENCSKYDGFLGGRMMGGGFGGCTVNLFEKETEQKAYDDLKEAYKYEFGLTLEMYIVKPVEGISRIL